MQKWMMAAAAAILVAAMPTQAATLVAGSGAAADSVPFGGGSGDKTTYQQLYNANIFSGPVAISAVSFERVGGGSLLGSGMVMLDASTSSSAVDALSGDFSLNLGADRQQLFSGTLQPLLSGNMLRFVFAAPFQFDPSKGNLLLSFNFESFISPDEAVLFRANLGDAGGVYSRVHDFGDGFAGYGLVTRFETGTIGAVPEPSTWAMLIIGFGLVGGAMRRRGPERLRRMDACQASG